MIEALLSDEFFPAGMELFPATDEDAFEFIKEQIQKSDYYVVILGGKYGSLYDDQISYTQKEYLYALEVGVPVLCFLHQNPNDLPGSRLEATDKGRAALAAFRTLCQKKMCSFCSNEYELASKVSLALKQAIKRYPRPGYVRGDEMEQVSAPELLRLNKEVARLHEIVADYKRRDTQTMGDLLQGDDKLSLTFMQRVPTNEIWVHADVGLFVKEYPIDDLFLSVATKMISGCSDSEFRDLLEAYALRRAGKDNELSGQQISFVLDLESFDQVQAQLMALEFIQKTDIKNERSRVTQSRWLLTKKGHHHMLAKLAKRREPADKKS